MTSLRIAIKASLNLEEKPSKVRPPPRGNRARTSSDDSTRHQRRHGGDDAVAGERQGLGAHSDRNRAAGSASKGVNRRGRSTGDAEDAPSDGSNPKIESESDGSVATSGRGRLSVHDRRQGTGNAVKREKTEPVPVSPPRQSIIAAAHKAEVGSQIKVRFDTGDWFSGIISEVDKQRGVIGIDYDDGTKETARIPDTDVVIYPWRAPERRGRPRPLSQYPQEARAGGKAGAEAGQSSGSSRKHAVKREPSPRRRVPQGRDRGSGGKREPSRGGRASCSQGGRGGSKVVSSPSSYEDDSGEGDDADDEGERWDEKVAAATSNGSRKNGRWQQKNGGKGAARGRASPHRQAQQRKRPAAGAGPRNDGARKRQRLARNVAVASVNDGGPSGSGSESESAPSEDEEELDDTSLGIKTKRNPRVGVRRTLPAKTVPQKNKGRLRRGNQELLKALSAGPATSMANRNSTTAGSSAMSESSDESSASNSSSNGVSRPAVGSGSEKKVSSEVVQLKSRTKTSDVQASRKDDGGQRKREGNDDAGLEVKERSQARGKAGQERNGEQPKDDAQPPDEPTKQSPKDEKSQSVPPSKATDSGSAPAAAVAAATAAAKSRQSNVKQSNAPRGWQESCGSIVHNRHSVTQANTQGVTSKTPNGSETAGLRGRGRAVRGQGSRGVSKGRQQSTRPGRLETSSRSVEGGQQKKRAEDARPDETSSSVPQKCAEEKESRSADLSSLRKSPRSKETPSSRLNEGTRRNQHGVPEVAEAKCTSSAPKPPSVPPATEASTGGADFYGWESRKQPKQAAHELVTVAPEKNATKVVEKLRVVHHKDGPSPVLELPRVSGGVDGLVPVKSQPSTLAGAGKKELKKKDRKRNDVNDGRPESWPQSDAEGAESKATRGKGAPNKKSKGKPNNVAKSGNAVPPAVATNSKVGGTRPVPTAVALPEDSPAVDPSDAASKSLLSNQVLANGSKKTETASVADADVTVHVGSTTDGVASLAPEVVNDRPSEAENLPTSSLEPEASAAVSPRDLTDDDAMDLDSSVDDASLSDSGEGEPDTPSTLLESPAAKEEKNKTEMSGRGEALPIDDTNRPLNVLKAEVSESDTAEAVLKRVTKPARKRPRSEEKPGSGAKSDWPAPMVSRAARPESASEDVDKTDARVLEATLTVGTSTLDGESPVASDSALSGSSLTVAEEGKTPAVSDSHMQTPSKEKAEVDNGVNSPTVSMEDSDPAPATKDKGSIGPAEVSKASAMDGGHKGRDPGSGKDNRGDATGDKVSASPDGGIDRDEVDTEPEVSTENEVPDKVVGDEVEGVDMEEIKGRSRHRPHAERLDDGCASRVEASKTTETVPTIAAVDGFGDKGPSTTPTVDDSGNNSLPFSHKPGSHPGVESRKPYVDRDSIAMKGEDEGHNRETPDEAAEETTVETRSRIKTEAKEESGAEDKDRREKNNSKIADKPARSDSGDGQSGSDGSGATSGESRPVGRRRSGVTRFEPSMETDRHRFGQHRPERHERQAAVLATKRLAASAPMRRASRGGRGHESGSRGRGRGRRGGRGGRGSRTIVQEPLEESDDDDDDDDDDEGGEGVDWVQCDNCLKWWTLPNSVNMDELPDVWHCRMQNWGKSVVDCLVPKEQRKSGTGAAQIDRRVEGKGAVRCSSSSPEPACAVKSAAAPTATPEVTTTTSATTTAVSTEHVPAAAEAEATVALVAAAATAAASAMEDTKTALRREETNAPIPTPVEVKEIYTEAKSSSRPALLTNLTPEAAGRPPSKVAALAHVPAKLPPEKPPPALPTDDPERRIVRGAEKPPTGVRRKRKRDGVVNVSSSDEECGRGTRDVGTNGHVEESRPRSNSVGGRLGDGSRGRVRKTSMGREAVAVLIKAAESRRDSEPPSEDAEDKTGRSGGPCVTRSSGGSVLGSGSSIEPVSNEEWVMCDHKNCGKWRRVPPGVNLKEVDKWYCEMATWSPATANCDHPEDTTEMVAPATTTSGRGNGCTGSSGGYRGRRIGSRSTRSAFEGSEGGGEEDKSWRRDGEGAPVERRSSDGASGNGVGRGRGRAKKDDLLWVQCDKCEKWRKLANGMRNEDLPEKWYCQMNNWSLANDCSFPDEYDAETNQANGDNITSWVVDTGGVGSGGRVSAGGLLARGASGINKKANGRLSYRDILFNNDGKLRPPYSAGPCASASAGYLFPKPGDVCASGVESESPEDLVSSRTGFHFSEKYCPVTGPKRPPPRQDLLTASRKLTSLLTPSLARPFGEAARVSLCSTNGHGMQQPVASSMGSLERAASDAVRYNRAWEPEDDRGRTMKISGSEKANGAIEPPAFVVESRATGSAMARANQVPRQTFPPHSGRIGTYERQRIERCVVLHYLREATMPRRGQGTCYPSQSNGTTAATLLAAMRKRPWEGRPNAGTLEEWRAWVDHLEPTLERHLRWLTVDGLAVQSDSQGKGEARFVAVVSTAGETDFDIWTEKHGSVGYLTGVSAGRMGARTGGEGVLGAVTMMNGGVRVMKSRPIKMVKPWR